MSDEPFLSRWSRLKRETPDNKAGSMDRLADANQTAASSSDPVSETAVDLASLPSLDSILADTDVSGFLQRGVPAELTTAALRRAWVADPAIRDFVGLAENQWDFTNPDAMFGFGPLRPSDDVAELVVQASGDYREMLFPGSDTKANEAAVVEVDGSDERVGAASEIVEIKVAMEAAKKEVAEDEEQFAAPQKVAHLDAPKTLLRHRSGGGALPE